MNFFVDDALNLFDPEAEARAIDTLAGLAGRWSEIAAAIDALRDTDDLFTLLIQLDDQIAPSAGRLEALGIDVESMRELSKLLKTLWDGAAPPALRKLLRPVGEFSEAEHGDDFGEVQWRPLRLAKATAGQLPGTALGFRPRLDAASALEVEAGAIAPPELPAGHAYLRFGFRGDVAAGLDLEMPLSFGLLGHTASAGSAALDYWFALDAAESATPFLAAAAARIRALPNPFALESLWSAAQQSFAGARLITTAGFSQTLSMRFSLKALTGAGLVGGAIDVLGDTLEFDARIVRERTYDMLIHAARTDADGTRVGVKLRRSRRADRIASSLWSIAIDFRQLAGQVAAVVDRYLGEYRTLQRRFDKYLQPGSLLASEQTDELDAAIHSGVRGHAALQDLLRALGGDEHARNDVLEAHLRRLLTEPTSAAADGLGGLLDQGVGMFSAQADRIAERLIERITEVAGESAGAALRPEIAALAAAARDDLAALVQRLQDDLDAQLAEEVGELFEAGGAVARRVFAEADEFAARAGEALEGAAQSLEAARAGVRSVLAAADSRIAALTTALHDAAHQRLTLRIGSEERLSLGAAANLEIEFTANTAKTRRLFEHVTRGEFDADTLAAMRSTPGVTAVSGRLDYFAESHSQRMLELGVLSFTGGSASFFDSRVAISADLDGNVVVGSEMSAARRLGGAREVQQIAFLSPFDLHTAKHTRVLTTRLTASQEDANYEVAEIEDFLDDFERLGLIGKTTLAAAVQQLADWRNAAGHDDFKARVDVALTLDAEAIDTLLSDGDGSGTATGELAADETATDTAAVDREMVEIVLDALVEAGAWEHETIERAARALRGLSRQFRRYTDTAEIFCAVPLQVLDGRNASADSQAFMDARFGTAHLHGGPRVLSARRGALRHAWHIHVLAKSYAIAIRSLRWIYALQPQSARSLRALTEQIDATNRLVGFCLRPWLRPGRRFLWLPNDEIHAVSHAFFLALATQSGQLARAAGDESIMSVVLRVPEAPDKTRVF